MKGTEAFKKTIQSYLEECAITDPIFEDKLANPSKSIDDCLTYIFNTVKKSGCNGFEDSEIFGMALHYYDEESVEVGSKINCNVVVNHTVQLTDEEIKQAKVEALKKIQDEAYLKMTAKKPVVKKEETQVLQPSLFD